MEIHAPDHPILNVKQALVHLSIVTIGILIALSFEGILESYRHHELVRESREHIRNEIRADQEALQSTRKLDQKLALLERINRAIRAADNLATPEGRKDAEILFGSTPDNLMHSLGRGFFNTASYTTAVNNGALGMMDYGEAISYSDAYDFQAIYVRAQSAAETNLSAAQALGAPLTGKPSPAEVIEVKRQLRLASSSVSLIAGSGYHSGPPLYARSGSDAVDLLLQFVRQVDGLPDILFNRGFDVRLAQIG